ncbi:MAG: AAA family ATPase [bacterium]|nr:AAA family ATPase [bacterium]
MTGKTGEANNIIYRKPARIFEDSGSVSPNKAYYTPLTNVTNTKKQDFKTMVDDGRYFSIFAPRQTGKTTFLEGIRRKLHREPAYVIIMLTFQDLNKVNKKEFYNHIEKKLYSQLTGRLREVGCEKCDIIEQFLDNHRLVDHLSFRELLEQLNKIVEFKKIVIFIDEFDGMPVNELENFLTTLRSLHQEYKHSENKALYSIGLIGIRNITKLIVGGVSPFNIADQVDFPLFSLQNVQDLFSQYTEETNQPFSEAAIRAIHEKTGGQPWLVNRLGTLLTAYVKPGTIETIDDTDVEKAIQLLLKEKNDHFDNLYEKAIQYKETFVEIVFDHVEYNPDNPDQGWLEQYGLIEREGEKAIVANSIYKARYLKTFFLEVQAYRDIVLKEYELPGNRLDMERILLDFEHYITQIGVNAFYQKQPNPAGQIHTGMITSKPYEKTGQFLLTAWLYQFVRGGAGELRYELISGLGRMDVILTYKGRKYIIETKINRGNLTRTINNGITQLSNKYLASESTNEGYLVIFDAKTPVGEDCVSQHHDAGDKKITGIIIPIGKIN